MPPESLDDRARYGTSLDIFSFGHLALFTITQVFPGSLLPSTFLNPDNPGAVQGRTELERREQYIDLLESSLRIFSSSHPDLIKLVKQCLHNDPRQRPDTDELLTRLRRMKVEVEGEYGGSPIRLDMVRVRLAKEVKVKGRRIEELTEQQERNEAWLTGEMEEKDRQIQELVTNMRTKDEQIETLQSEMANKDGQRVTMERELANKNQRLATVERELGNRNERLATMEGELANRDEHIATVERELANRDERLASMEGEMANRDGRDECLKLATMEGELSERDERLATMERELAKRDERFATMKRELSSRIQQLEVPQLKFPLQLTWRHGPDMPIGMSFHIQSVVVQGRVYVGGGNIVWGENYKVIMEYNPTSAKWVKLPPYRLSHFGMTAINNQLVLVGGRNADQRDSKMLGVWEPGWWGRWTHPYTEMSTTRSNCSAVVYREWVIVAGGWSTASMITSSVEV